MYAYIRGKLTQLFPTHVVVESINGVDMKFRLQIPSISKIFGERISNLYIFNC